MEDPATRARMQRQARDAEARILWAYSAELRARSQDPIIDSGGRLEEEVAAAEKLPAAIRPRFSPPARKAALCWLLRSSVL